MRNILRRIGWAMISLGAFTLYFLVYQLVGTNAITNQAQEELRDDLVQQFQAQAQGPRAEGERIRDEPKPKPGKAFAVISIPDIDVEKFIVHGHERPGIDPGELEDLRREDLKRGPAHIATSKLPGGEGTFAVAGHRTTYGAPFNRLDELDKGDEIRVKTAIATYTYKVTSIRIVSPTQVEVLRDVRDADGKIKSQIVLSTCHPKFSAAQRLIVFGELEGSEPSDGTVTV